MARRPVHPGEVLAEDVLSPLELSANTLAKLLHVPTNRITELVAGKRAITADTAVRLARFLGASPEFWLGLQTEFELDTYRMKHGNRIEQEIHPYAKAS